MKLVFLLGYLISASVWGMSVEPRERGAVWFMNYCGGCHTLRAISWDQMVSDLHLSPKRVLPLGSRLRLSMPDLSQTWPELGLSAQDAIQWFGQMPPDLSYVAQYRGKAWVKAYLYGFYVSPERPWGTDNQLLPRVMMPNVLESLQGEQSWQDAGQRAGSLLSRGHGELSDAAFHQMMDDMILFLDYVADPSVEARYTLGPWVLGFLGVVCLLMWGLYRQSRF